MGKAILVLLLVIAVAYLAFRDDQSGSSSGGEPSGVAAVYWLSQRIRNPRIRTDFDRLVEDVFGPRVMVGDPLLTNWIAVDWNGNQVASGTTLCGLVGCAAW